MRLEESALPKETARAVLRDSKMLMGKQTSQGSCSSKGKRMNVRAGTADTEKELSEDTNSGKTCKDSSKVKKNKTL